MKRKALLILSLLLVLSLGWVAAAGAQGLTEGSGRLWAKGVGYAQVHGSGEVDIDAHGAGTVRVRGAEVLRVQGHGHRWDLPDGSTLFAGWRGHIHVAGHNVDVQMLGGVIEFTAQGHGWAFLKGIGHYRANGQPGQWTAEGVRIELQPNAETE